MEELDECKLFVGGISRETTEEALKQHFGVYGTIVSCTIGKDRCTGTARGFAFVCFSHPSALLAALKHPSHDILGRTVEVKKAIPRNDQKHTQEQSRGLTRNRSDSKGNDYFKTKKVFVGGLSANLTEEEFQDYFEKFGRIIDVVVMHDNMTNRPRGFGFITFDTEESVEDVMQKSFHELGGKLVEVKRAVPKELTGPNTRVGDIGGRGSYLNRYQHPMYSPRSEVFPGYGSFPGYGGIVGYPFGASVYGGVHSTGGYGGLGFGPLPQGPWTGRGMLPYGSLVYPAFLNNGVGLMGMAANGYYDIRGSTPTIQLSQAIRENEQVGVDVAP